MKNCKHEEIKCVEEMKRRIYRENNQKEKQE